MKLALVSTPATAEPLLAHLEGHFDLRLFAEVGAEGTPVGDLFTEPADALFPREHDQILFALANTAEHGFLLPLIRLLGGVVALDEWELGTVTRAAFPALAGDGLGARMTALREGRALNRSVVRFADAFLVPHEELRQQILVDRNAPTPIAVVPGPEAFVEPLTAFPRPRAARKRLFWQRVRLAARRREG